MMSAITALVASSLGGIGGDDAVAVERFGGESRGGGGGFVKSDFAVVRLAQNLPGEIGDQLAFRRRRH